MRLVLCISIFYCSLLTGQTLTDVASSQNINAIQSTFDHFGNGMTFYDFNDDGWDDLTFPTNNDSIVFYINNNGSFTQIASYIYAIDQVREILWVDYDNNGVLDLCVSYHNLGVRLYNNDGLFNFTDVTSAAGISTAPSLTFGFSFADADTDGDLDLYVCSYETTGYVPSPVPNKLYENLGNGTFQDVAGIAGVNNGLKLTFMGVWFDYNNDDLIDLHVVNDRASFADGLYENLGGASLNFIDVAAAEGIDNFGHFPMTSSVSDFDNDGFQDVFVTDISDGNPLYQYELFKNQNGGNFINVAPLLNIDTSIYAWGALWVDYNNDGFEDLYVATSFIDTINNTTSESFLYRNEAGLGFTLMNDSIIGNTVKSSYCPVKGDINNDGFYDVVVLNDASAPNVFLNSADNGNNFIKILPVGTVSNKNAIGAKIKVYAGGINQYQTVFCGSGFCAQNSRQKIFGVGNSTSVDSLEIIFPSGIIVKRYNLAINQKYIIPEQTIVNIDIIPNTDTLNLCVGDSISIGTGGYTNYLWNTGSTDSVIVVSVTGDYEYQAISVANDTIIQSNLLHVNVESEPLYIEVVSDPICGIGNFGDAEIIFVVPADTVYVITWFDGSQGQVLDSILPGSYSYTLTSPNNCNYTYNFSVEEILPFDVIFFTTPASDTTGGTIQFNTFGGVGPYTYTLDTTVVSSFIDSLSPGTYSIEVVDANNCVVVVEFTILDGSTSSISTEKLELFNAFHSYGSLWICSESIDEIIEVKLIDMAGRNIELDKWGKVNDRCIKTPIDLPQGIYTIRINTSITTSTDKFFVR